MKVPKPFVFMTEPVFVYVEHIPPPPCPFKARKELLAIALLQPSTCRMSIFLCYVWIACIEFEAVASACTHALIEEGEALLFEEKKWNPLIWYWRPRVDTQNRIASYPSSCISGVEVIL